MLHYFSFCLQMTSISMHGLHTATYLLCRKIVDETLSKWGQLDVLVNNASFQGKAVEKFEEITRERMEFTFHSNILNYFSTCQAAAKHMKEGSTIININSIQGYNPSPAVLDYSTTKVCTMLAALLHDCCVQQMGHLFLQRVSVM